MTKLTKLEIIVLAIIMAGFVLSSVIAAENPERYILKIVILWNNQPIENHNKPPFQTEAKCYQAAPAEVRKFLDRFPNITTIRRFGGSIYGKTWIPVKKRLAFVYCRRLKSDQYG